MLGRKEALALVTYVILMIIAGTFLQGIVGGVWRSWVNYTPPALAPTRTGSEPLTEPIVDRVVIVLLDGARPDVIEELAGSGGFKDLLEHGCWFENAYALPPTYSVPARAAMATGLPHELSGVTSNWYGGGELQVPNVFSLAKEAGLKTAVVGDESLHYMFASYIDVYVEVEESRSHMEKSIRHAIELLQGGSPPGLLWVSLADVDKAGHEHGASSLEYKYAAREASSLIAELLEAVEGLPGDTLVILVSDHGHLPSGGHGGTEEEVSRIVLGLIGASVKGGLRVSEEVHYTSLAPTVVMALALPPKLAPHSPPLVWAFTDDVLDAKAKYVAAMARNYEQQLRQLAETLGLTVNSKLDEASSTIDNALQALRSGDSKDALELSLKAFKELSQVYESMKADPRMGPGLSYPAAALALLALTVGLIAIASRSLGRRIFWKPILGSVVGIIAFWIYFTRVEGYLLTMSSVNELGDYIGAIVNSTIVALAVTAAVTTPMLTLSRLSEDDKGRMWIVPILAHLTMLAIFSIPIFVMLAVYGATVRFPFPDWRLAYMYYTALITDLFLMFFNWLLPAAILGGVMLTFKLSKR